MASPKKKKAVFTSLIVRKNKKEKNVAQCCAKNSAIAVGCHD